MKVNMFKFARIRVVWMNNFNGLNSVRRNCISTGLWNCNKIFVVLYDPTRIIVYMVIMIWGDDNWSTMDMIDKRFYIMDNNWTVGIIFSGRLVGGILTWFLVHGNVL